MSDALLQLSGVHTHIAEYHVLHGVDFSVRRGGVTALLGRNGAGKTTTLRTIMGLWRASRGRVVFDGQDLASLPTPRIARLGIGYVPENMGLFHQLTVRENMVLATRAPSQNAERLDWVLSIFPALKAAWNRHAGTLSGGQRQMLAIARAIIEPKKLILVDEPTKGLAPAVVDELMAIFQLLKQQATTILLVEQSFGFACELADRVTILESGRVGFEGDMRELTADAEMQQRLLGLSLEQ